MKNHNLDMKFLEGFLVKSELASDRLSFLSKMGLEFFLAGLEFFLKTHKKRAWHNWNMQPHTSMLKSRIQKHISGNNSGNIYGCFCYLELPCQIYEAATRNFNGISGKETAFSSRLVMYFSAGSKLHRNFKIVSVPYGLPFKMMRNQLKLSYTLLR